MSSAPPTIDPTTAALMRLVESRYDEIKALMERFEIPPAECEQILDEVMMVLVHRYDHLADPGKWLSRTLRERCLRSLRQRRAHLARRTEERIERWITAGTEEVQDGRRRHLHALIDALPRACRAPLRRRWPLGVSADPSAAASAPRTPAPTDPGSSLSHPLRRPDPLTRCLHLLLRRALDTPSDA